MSNGQFELAEIARAVPTREEGEPYERCPDCDTVLEVTCVSHGPLFWLRLVSNAERAVVEAAVERRATQIKGQGLTTTDYDLGLKYFNAIQAEDEAVDALIASREKAKVRKTGEGVILHEHVCDKCGQVKQCIPGFQQVGNEKPQEIFSCPECLDRERDEYLGRLQNG